MTQEILQAAIKMKTISLALAIKTKYWTTNHIKQKHIHSFLFFFFLHLPLKQWLCYFLLATVILCINISNIGRFSSNEIVFVHENFCFLSNLSHVSLSLENTQTTIFQSMATEAKLTHTRRRRRTYIYWSKKSFVCGCMKPHRGTAIHTTTTKPTTTTTTTTKSQRRASIHCYCYESSRLRVATPVEKEMMGKHHSDCRSDCVSVCFLSLLYLFMSGFY